MKYRLLAPGPTPVPDKVLRAMSQTIMHHRTRQFEIIFHECQQGLSWLLNTNKPPLILSCSGTGAFEAAIVNFFNPNDTILCITGGKFADNWLKMSRIFGLNAIEIPIDWGQAIDPLALRHALANHPQAAGVILVASETSTGVKHPVKELGDIIKEYKDCLFIVDGVTAVGVFDIAPEQDNIDVLVFGSQKGLMLPPGLGFIWVSDKAWYKSHKTKTAKFYFDLAKEQKNQSQCQSSYTPAVSLIIGLKEALAIMKGEGRLNIFHRHQRLALATRKAIEALGLTLFTKHPSEALTSVYNPLGLTSDSIYQGLMSMANFTIAGGQDKLAGKIFRIGHMGYVDEIDLIGVLGALEIILTKLGFEKFTPGASIAAASPILMPGFNDSASNN